MGTENRTHQEMLEAEGAWISRGWRALSTVTWNCICGGREGGGEGATEGGLVENYIAFCMLSVSVE